MVTNGSGKIDQIGPLSFVHRSGIPKWIGLSQSQCQKIHLR